MGYYERVTFTRVTFGQNVLQTGDERLLSVSVDLGEDKRSATCTIEVNDPGLVYSGEKFVEIEAQGGIIVSPELLQDPQPPAATAGTGEATVGAPGSSGFTQGQASNELAIIAECLRQGVSDVNQIAYILATAYHESDRFNTLEEYASGEAYEGRSDLGNTQPGDGVRFKGRGYVQLTGRINYQRYSDLLGVDLIGNPEQLATNASMSAYVLVHGMANGTYTGVGLSDYIGGGRADFVGARAIVNGDVALNGGMIAGYADDYLSRLQSGDLASALTGATTAAPPPTTPEPTTEDTTTATETPPETIETPTADVGTEIIVELGFESAEQTISYHFIHTGLDVAMRPDVLTIKGQSIRWLLDRRKKNTAYENITLRQLAENICAAHGLTLNMVDANGEPFDGTTYAYLSQDGISDLRLLLRECRAHGLRVVDDGAVLTIEPWVPHFTNFVVTPDILISASWSDSAITERRSGAVTSDAQLETESEPDSEAGKASAAINPLTSEIVVLETDDPTGTGNAVRTFTTGSQSLPVHGTPQAEPTPTQAETRSAAELILEVPPPVLDTSITGLPNQKIGAADLADDGTATAEAIPNESRRVKGVTGSLELLTTYPVLTLVPGSIFGLDPALFNNDYARRAFAREYRVGRVGHKIGGGHAVTTIEFYTPQKAAPEQAVAAASAGATGAATTGATNVPSDLNAAIYAAAQAYIGTDTSSGPDGGTNACAWSVNAIIANATGGGVIGSANPVHCPTVYNWCLQPGNAVQIPLSEAQPGDIVFSHGAYHIGIATGNGRVISNSSSRTSFVWDSNIEFDNFYDSKDISFEGTPYPAAVFRLQRVD